MRKFIFIFAFSAGMLSAQQSTQTKVDSTRKEEILPIFPVVMTPKNEVAIANFFPMIFQQTWGGNMGAIYKRYLKNNLALRFHINGSINQSNRFAFDNSTLATKISDEYNDIKSGSVNFNVGLGLQKGFYAGERFSVYQLLDLFMGGYSYNQITVNTLSEVNGPNGRTIVSFSRYESGQTNVSNSLKYGIGLNYQFTKNFMAQIETNIDGVFSTISVMNQRKTIDLNIADNSYFVSRLDETKTPDYTTTNFNLTPTTTLYFSYTF